MPNSFSVLTIFITNQKQNWQKMQFRLQSEIFSNPPRQTIIYLLKIPIYEFVSNENRDREKIMFFRCCFSKKKYKWTVLLIKLLKFFSSYESEFAKTKKKFQYFHFVTSKNHIKYCTNHFLILWKSDDFAIFSHTATVHIAHLYLFSLPTNHTKKNDNDTIKMFQLSLSNRWQWQAIILILILVHLILSVSFFLKIEELQWEMN